MITLGVIGVVAGMTLPNLIHKAQDRATVVRLKKTYSVLNQAFRRAVDDYGTIETWCDAEKYRAGDRAECLERIPAILSQYLPMQSAKISVNYTKRLSSGKFNMGSSSANNNTTYLLNDGTILYFSLTPGDNISRNWCKATSDLYGAGRFYYLCGTVYVDVTGKSRPNVNNKDFFAFKIFQDGITPMGNSADNMASYYHRFNEACMKENGNYGACTGWVLSQENMDYQYCSDLSYNGKTKCH